MKKKSVRRKRNSKRSAKRHESLWLYLCIICLCLINILFLDLLIGMKAGRHFLPGRLYKPFASFFTTMPSGEVPLFSKGKLLQGKSLEKKIPEKKQKAIPAKSQPAPRPEEVSMRATPPPPKKAPVVAKPRVALVIDDLGYNPDLAEELFQIDFPFTVSVLPNLPHSEFIAKRAIQKGKEVILHLPMEPYDYPNMHIEKDTLLTSMEDEEIRRLIQKALENMDCVVGANNHMGSRMVENREKMVIVLEEMKKRGLFFLDSRTSPNTVVYDLAQTMQVKSAERDVFLDGQNDVDYILKKIEEVADLAQNEGCGIAIGHLQPKTIEALRRCLSQLDKRGIQMVKLSEVIK
ncbi:divergent polysaccharide deacetylase family protein [bacterium]|nr:divergent polysaccharide deacetylase family protein [bacterium]